MAKWVRFSEHYDERHTARKWTSHPAGSEAFVREEIAEDVVKKGKGEIIHAPDDKKTTKAGKTVERIALNDAR